jgi:two-component system cell cycle sensor histidine kinase/response regulator CckA
VLTDVIMPGLKGPALFKEISTRFPMSRVLYMSGYTDDLVSHHGVLEEGIAFIQKPFSVHQLTARVREVLDLPEGN